MLKLLSKLFNRDITAPSEPIDTNVSDEEIWEILHPLDRIALSNKKKKLKCFMQFVTSHLSKKESQRLTRIAVKSLEEAENPFEALAEVIFKDEGQKRGQWVFIQIDWNAAEEISWQVSEILSLYGIGEEWVHDCAIKFIGSENTVNALRNLSEWLKIRGFSLLHLETGGDCYCSFIVRDCDASTAKKLAANAEIKVYDHDEFANL
jgi:hypothetical protein